MRTPIRPSTPRFLLCALAIAAAAAPRAEAQAHDHAGMHAAPATDSAAVVAAVHAYHAALQAGDTAAAVRLLAMDVRVAESGGVETREEYLSHHLPGDMAFAAAVARETGTVSVTVVGDVAWAMSTSRTRGTYRDRAIDSVGAELMVLARTADGWRIRAIHWSSRQAR